MGVFSERSLNTGEETRAQSPKNQRNFLDPKLVHYSIIKNRQLILLSSVSCEIFKCNISGQQAVQCTTVQCPASLLHV